MEFVGIKKKPLLFFGWTKIAADQLRTPGAAVEPAFMTHDAATGESTRDLKFLLLC
jgi:hypothetical protein